LYGKLTQTCTGGTLIALYMTLFLVLSLYYDDAYMSLHIHAFISVVYINGQNCTDVILTMLTTWHYHCHSK